MRETYEDIDRLGAKDALDTLIERAVQEAQNPKIYAAFHRIVAKLCDEAAPLGADVRLPDGRLVYRETYSETLTTPYGMTTTVTVTCEGPLPE